METILISGVLQCRGDGMLMNVVIGLVAEFGLKIYVF